MVVEAVWGLFLLAVSDLPTTTSPPPTSPPPPPSGSSASIFISLHRVAAAFANFLDALGVDTAAGAPARQVQMCKLSKEK